MAGRRKQSTAEQRWLPWLRKNLHAENPAEIQLHQIGPQGSTAIQRWPVGDDLSSWTEEKQRELVIEAEQLVANDAEGLGGDNTYALAFSAGPGRVIDLRSPVWTLRILSGSIEPSESPSEKGVSAQLMRHLEATQRNFGAILETVSGIIVRSHESDRMELEHLRASHYQVIHEREELLDRSDERKLRALQAEEEYRLKYEAWKTFAPLIPAGVNKLVGRRVMPEDAVPLVELAKAVAGSLSAADIGKIAEVLADQPEKLVGMLELVNELKKLHEEQVTPPSKPEAAGNGKATAGN